MQAVGIVDGRNNQLLLVLWILEIVPGGWRRPAFLREDLGVVHQTGRDDADADRAIILEAGRVVEIGRQAIDLAAETKLDRLIHRTVIDDGNVDLLIALLSLQLGKRVCRIASDVFDLDAVGLLKAVELVTDRLLEGAAVTRNIERLLLRQNRRRCQGERCDADRFHKGEMLHMNRSPIPFARWHPERTLTFDRLKPSAEQGACTLSIGIAVRRIEFAWRFSDFPRLASTEAAQKTGGARS